MKKLLLLIMLFWTMSLYADDWPRQVQSSEGIITMYQPQIEAYDGNSMKARAAVSIVLEGKQEPIFGAIWVTCRVLTDRPSRTVYLEDMEVRRIRFPEGTGADTARIADALEEVIPRSDLTFSLDLLLESIETAQKERENVRELDLAPPKIIVMNRPAVLVQIDGNPILTNVEGTSLKRVANTPYFLVQDVYKGRFYLHGGDIWFTAKKIKGPWSKTSFAPKSVLALYEQTKSEDESDKDAEANDVYFTTGKVPQIVVSTEPAELIATDGPIKFSAVRGTGLLYATNTPGRLFLLVKTQQRFILISGRWYIASSLKGPWKSIASDELPEDFRNIPPGSECDDVLASVSGTIPAREAAFDAQIPQMAEVDLNEATSEVEYDGDPQFESIENTDMDYAVNTSTAVIRVNGRYYDCDRGVWFEGATPYGPWVVCTYVPDVIYTIPPSCPIYNVRYVRVYYHTPNHVYVGYTAGYMGCYVYKKAIVYGTGYNYHHWYKHNYYARPLTYGFNVHYNPWTGWSFGDGWGKRHGWFADQPKEVHPGWWGPAEDHPNYQPIGRAVYREGYHPVRKQKEPAAPVVKPGNETRRTGGITRQPTLYDNRTSAIRRPIAIEKLRSPRDGSRATPTITRQPDSRPINMPAVTPVAQPQAQPVTKPETPRTPRQPETSPISRPVMTPVTQPQTQPVAKPETPRTPRQPENTPTSQPVATPVTQPQAQPVTKPETPRTPRQPEITPTGQPVATPVIQPQTQPIAKPETPRTPFITPVAQPHQQPVPRPEPPQIITRPGGGANNVYAAPNGSIIRVTPQGMQERDRNTWKKAEDTPARQETVHDNEVRQRAAERTSSPTVTPSPAPTRSSSPSVTPSPAPTRSSSPSVTPSSTPSVRPSPSSTPQRDTDDKDKGRRR